MIAAKECELHTFATLGLKANTSILLWIQSDTIEQVQDATALLVHTDLGKYFHISHTLTGIARRGQYGQTGDPNDTVHKGGKYLIIYPFSKTADWYLLPFKKRQKLMRGHMEIGQKYPQVSQILLYSYGIDDQEFIVSYETDDLPLFQKLVMDLRSDAVRKYTLRDTPIFTCIYKSYDKVLHYL